MFRFIWVFLFLPVVIWSQSFIIETSRGPREVVIPEDYTVEEAFLEMAELYLEERWSHEDTISDHKRLIDAVKLYRQMVEEYEHEISVLEDMTRRPTVSPLLSGTVGLTVDGGYTVGVGGGAMFFDRITTQIFVEAPFVIRLGIGYRF